MPGSRQRCLYRKAPRKNPSAADVQAAGGRAAAIEADVTDADEVDRLAAEVTAALGPADVLILNAAGISQPAVADTRIGAFSGAGVDLAWAGSCRG